MPISVDIYASFVYETDDEAVDINSVSFIRPMPITVDIYASFVYETDDEAVDIYTSFVYHIDDKADDETFKRAENCAVQ